MADIPELDKIALKGCPFCGARAFVVGYRKATYVDGKKLCWEIHNKKN